MRDRPLFGHTATPASTRGPGPWSPGRAQTRSDRSRRCPGCDTPAARLPDPARISVPTRPGMGERACVSAYVEGWAMRAASITLARAASSGTASPDLGQKYLRGGPAETRPGVGSTRRKVRNTPHQAERQKGAPQGLGRPGGRAEARPGVGLTRRKRAEGLGRLSAVIVRSGPSPRVYSQRRTETELAHRGGTRPWA